LNWHIKEFVAALIVIIFIAAVPYAIFGNAPWVNEKSMRVMHLTAVTEDGVWTDAKVNAGNYWSKKFKPAHIILQKGEKVLLRLSSSDVTHTFYVPELNVGPVIVDGGHTEEVTIQSDKTGDYTYYCVIVCGECHYYMQGYVSVVDADTKVTSKIKNMDISCSIHTLSNEYGSLVEKGKHLFAQKGCITCHGENGAGGVYNPNYVNTYVPELNTLADKMKIYWQEDADTVLKLLEMGDDLEALEDDPPFRSYNRFLAQYNSIRTKIIEGAPDLQMIDPQGPIPPLYMPAWEEQLSDQEIDAIISYLLSEFSWEEQE
jgi:plastocyanin